MAANWSKPDDIAGHGARALCPAIIRSTYQIVRGYQVRSDLEKWEEQTFGRSTDKTP